MQLPFSQPKSQNNNTLLPHLFHLKMKSLIVTSYLLAVTLAFPQEISVVRPNHYLQPGTFRSDQHLLPESFFKPGQQVEEELKNIRVAAASQPQATAVEPQHVQEQQQAQAPATSGHNSAESTAPDSYTNIGGGVASGLTDIHEYGEKVPPAFSKLDHDTYAYYHGKSN